MRNVRGNSAGLLRIASGLQILVHITSDFQHSVFVSVVERTVGSLLQQFVKPFLANSSDYVPCELETKTRNR